MPNRILKESICSSDNIDKLSAFHETVFYRLIVNCDDYGRMDARPKILASRLFPLKDIRVNQMEDALRALSSAELVTLYTVDGKPFLQMNTWDRHQRVRAQVSKYPGPDSGTLTSADICCQMTADADKCVRNPIQSESNPNPNPESNVRAREDDEIFDAFWSAYPKKVGKGDARRAFGKVPKSVWPKLVPAVEAQKNSRQWQEEGGRFIPNPATWLNQGRWDDEAAEDSIPTKPSQIYGSAGMHHSPEKIKAFMDFAEGL